MRHDETTRSSRLSQPSGTDSSISTLARAWAGPVGMALLVALTCLAVAAYAAAWLVIPYLAMMALVLGVPSFGRRAQPLASPQSERATGSHASRNAGAATDEARGEHVAPPQAAVKVVAASVEDPAGAEASSSGAEPSADSESPVLKSRRGKGRGRKAKPSATPDQESSGAYWVRVGPGKFVRADSVAPASAPTLAVVDGTPGADDAESAVTLGSDRDEVPCPDPIAPTADFVAEATVTETPEDNGIAPDAPSATEAVAESEVAAAEPLVSEEAAPRQEPRPAQPLGPVFRARAGSLQRSLRGRLAAATRAFVSRGVSRRIRSLARVSGTRRQTYRCRVAVRDHPPRSPPAGSARVAVSRPLTNNSPRGGFRLYRRKPPLGVAWRPSMADGFEPRVDLVAG